MATVNDVLGVARSQLGYASTSTSSKFNSWYGMSGYWCAMFISWCAYQAGAAGVIPRHAYTPSGAAWFKKRGAWHSGARGLRPGDIVYFNFGLGRISHVGIFEGWKNGLVVTIDGNTGSGGGRTGGRVLRRARPARYVVGYGRPAYSGGGQAAVGHGGGLTVDGYWGPATTAALQRINQTPVDGIVSGQARKYEACPSFRLGKGGSPLIRAMQKAFKVSQDGVVGPETIRGMQRYYQTPVDGVLSGGGRSAVIRAMQSAINRQLGH